MGLDQYAHVRRAALPSPVDFTAEPGDVFLQSWRKHPNLQGWMEALYRKKGGKAEDFNCAAVEITLEDLEALEQAVKSDALPETTGFFFGVSQPEDRELDLEFIEKARDAIAAGGSVFYSSWW